MGHQLNVFTGADGFIMAREDFPVGFRITPNLVTPEEEVELLARIGDLPFREFEFHGYKGKRRVVSFGCRDDSAARDFRQAEEVPPFLLELRDLAAQFGGLEPGDLQHILVTEYGSGAGIGWHRDKSVFGIVIGISLLSPCVFRLRRRIGDRRWERFSLIAEPRTAYLLSDAVREEWEHSIPPVSTLRYSVTFRSVRKGRAAEVD